MFSEFDFSSLDSADAVREEIIDPILKRLGYGPNGQCRVNRGRALKDPFVMIGSTQQVIEIIPDYLLYVGERALATVEAKSPGEPLIQSVHVEQAYSYAIHPDVEVTHYALCNGRELVVYETFEIDPILRIDLADAAEDGWWEIEKALHPRYLQHPTLRKYMPDYGLALLRSGYDRELMNFFYSAPLQNLMRVTGELFTGCIVIKYDGTPHMVSLDFSLDRLEALLAGLPTEVAIAMWDSLQRGPGKVDIDGKIRLTCSGHLDKITRSGDEVFVPILVTSVSDVAFDRALSLRNNQRPPDA